jgi:hypothetical protein
MNLKSVGIHFVNNLLLGSENTVSLSKCIHFFLIFSCVTHGNVPPFHIFDAPLDKLISFHTFSG